MVCLYDSQLFRESNISKADFTKVFHRSPMLKLRHLHDLDSFIRVCDFFMIDELPFEDIAPFSDFFHAFDDEKIPPLLKEWYMSFFLAFHGNMESILRYDSVYSISVMKFAQNRIQWTCRSYFFIIGQNITDTTISKLDTLFSFGISPPSYAMELALRNKNNRVIDWLLCHHVPLISYHLSVAMKHNFPIDFIKRLVETYHCPIHSHTIASACSEGKLHYVEWWHQHDLPFCTSASAWAALFGQVDTLRFLLKHQKPMNRTWTIQNAYRSKNTTAILNLLGLITTPPNV